MKRLTTKNRPWRSCSVSFDRKFDTVSKLQSWQIEPRRPLTSSNFSTFIGFPTTLYDMLESALDEGYSNLMSWFEDGQSFRTPTRREKKIYYWWYYCYYSVSDSYSNSPTLRVILLFFLLSCLLLMLLLLFCYRQLLLITIYNYHIIINYSNQLLLIIVSASLF